MSRLDRSRRASAIVVLLLAAIAVFGVQRADAQATGTVTGQVMAGKGPAEFANVIILGTRRGAMTDENGHFTITLVPVGSHTIKVQAPGFDPKQQVITVNAGPNTIGTINVGAQKVVKEIEEVKVTAQRMIDVKSSSTKQTVTGETLKDLPVENLQEAIGLKAGVVATGGELHVRGGRGGEIKYQVEGIEVADPLFGRGASIANLSVAGAEVL